MAKHNMIYRTEDDRAILPNFLPSIIALANEHKEALGFLPESAYREAMERQRLVIMRAGNSAGEKTLAGFILFSGVFPNARIQQVAVGERFRRDGVGSALINFLVSRLEAQGYLTVSAAVAADLLAAQEFYSRNGFVARRKVPGGRARKRTIILYARDLETQSLLSALEPSQISPSRIDLGLRKRNAWRAPLFAIDLNVIFDVTKQNRPREPLAGKLIAAALDHKIRLAVAPEFIVELERQIKAGIIDPVLKLARQLPRLPSFDGKETDHLSKTIHDIVFVRPRSPAAGSVQALSDCRHLAQAALAHASGYVTSDSQVLGASEALLREIGVDVVDLHEFESLLNSEASMVFPTQIAGTDRVVRPATVEEAKIYLEEQCVLSSLISQFACNQVGSHAWFGRAVVEDGELVALGVYLPANSIDASARILVHVRSDHVSCDVFADHLIDVLCHDACASGPVVIEMPSIAGQTVVRRVATLRGFFSSKGDDTLIKVAIGRPITPGNWNVVIRQTRRKTGLRLPESPIELGAISNGVPIICPNGETVTVSLPDVEDVIGPTVLIWPGRNGVIVPIAKAYADELLGTGIQFPLFGSPEASFHANRTYFNSPRKAALMRAGSPILFYESIRSGGRGAIVAIARIVDATVMLKERVSSELFSTCCCGGRGTFICLGRDFGYHL